MKIIFLTTSLSAIGGIQRYNRVFIDSLRKNGAKVVILEVKNGMVFGKALFALKFFRILISEKPELVICGHINFSGLGYISKTIFGSKYIVTLFGIEARAENIKKYKKILESADKICTVSSYTIEKILESYPGLQKSIYFLENPIDANKFRPLEKDYELMEKLNLKGKKIILTVSRMSAQEKYKGYDKVLEAIALIKEEIPDFVYVVIGDGDDRERLMAIAKGLNLENKLILPGFIDENLLIKYYNLADIFVMPSKNEGFGFVFLEALACGVPTIAGNADGSVSPLLYGKIGTLVNPDSPKEIGNAIKNILFSRVDKSLLNKDFVRTEVVSAYGTESFERKVKKLINEL